MIRLNITTEEGTLLGTLELTVDELRAARNSTMAAVSLVDEIASEAGVR